MTTEARRFAVGAGWLYSYRWGERLLDALAILVLARILAPEDFGLVAIAASVVAILEGLSAFDVNKALIRIRDDDRDLYDTAFTLSALRGLVSALLMLAAAFFVTEARIGNVLMVLSVSPALSGLSNPRFVMFERDLVYSRLAALTLGAKLASFGVTIAAALLYRNYWSLVAGMLAGTVVTVALSYLLRPYRPRITWARFPDIFSFSGWLSLTSVVTTLSMETDKLIVGRLLGVADAGRYFMTQRVGALPTRELVSPLQRILFPSFSGLARDRERLRRLAAESVNVLGSLSLPAGAGFALVANDFVPLVLGDAWNDIVPLMVVLAPYLGLRATLSMALPCVMALGRTKLLFWVSFVYALVHIPAFVAGTASFGLIGAVGSIVAAGALYVYLNAWLLAHTLDITFGEILTQLGRPLLAAASMVLVVLTLDAATTLDLFSRGGALSSLLLKVLIGSLVFCGVQYALWRSRGRPAGIERRLQQVLGR